jgi:cytidylate kinase
MSPTIREPEFRSGVEVSAVPACAARWCQAARHGGETRVRRPRHRTVVFPDAQVKVFLAADPRARAGRRLLELKQKGIDADAGQVAGELGERDERDRRRADSPLTQAPDAVYLDTTPLSLDEVEQAILKLIRDRTSNGKELTS